MTQREADALLVLAPGAFVRAGVPCPVCRRTMRAQPRWRIQGALIEWIYVCPRSCAVLDSALRPTEPRWPWIPLEAAESKGRS